MKSRIISLQILNAMILGITYAVSKFGLQQMAPLQLLSFRFLFATALLMLIIGFGKTKPDFSSGLRPMLLIYCAQPVLYYLLETNALRLLPSAYVSIVLSAAPISTCLFSFLLLHEKITTRQFLFLLLSTTGVVALNVYGLSGNEAVSLVGLLYVVGALLLNGIGAIVCKQMLDTYSAMTLTVLDMSTKAVAFTVIGLVQAALASSVSDFFLPILQMRNLLVVAFLGIFPSIAFNIIQLYCLKKESVSFISVFSNLTPVFTMVVSAFILSEHVSVVEVLCLILVIAGLTGYLTISGKRTRKLDVSTQQADSAKK